jgi:hypothetical protein
VKLRGSKNLKKIVEDSVRSQKECMGDLSVIFLLLKEKNVQKSLYKITPQSPKETLSTYQWSTSFCTWHHQFGSQNVN